MNRRVVFLTAFAAVLLMSLAGYAQDRQRQDANSNWSTMSRTSSPRNVRSQRATAVTLAVKETGHARAVAAAEAGAAAFK